MSDRAKLFAAQPLIYKDRKLCRRGLIAKLGFERVLVRGYVIARIVDYHYGDCHAVH